MLAEETGDFSLKITAISLKIIGVWTARNKAEKRRRTFGFVSTMIFILNSVQAEVTDFVYQWRRNDLESSTQFRILQYKLANIVKQINKEKYSGSLETVPGYVADNSYATFKKCVEHHQRLLDYCDKVQTIFSLVGLAQVMSFSMLLCIGGYLLMVDGAEFFNRVLYLMHTIGCTSQLFTFSYSCDCVMRESEAVCQAAYDIQWTILPYNESGKILRRDLQMVVVRAREPCYVTAGGFFPVCLETFSKVISTAVSYFTLLRQTSIINSNKITFVKVAIQILLHN
nr:odorant receptor Or2-like [Megalopta genalis]